MTQETDTMPHLDQAIATGSFSWTDGNVARRLLKKNLPGLGRVGLGSST